MPKELSVALLHLRRVLFWHQMGLSHSPEWVPCTPACATDSGEAVTATRHEVPHPLSAKVTMTMIEVVRFRMRVVFVKLPASCTEGRLDTDANYI